LLLFEEDFGDFTFYSIFYDTSISLGDFI